MFNLLIATLFFLTTHIVLSSTGLRTRLVGRVGETGFMVVYSLISLITLIWMIRAYGQTPHTDWLWLSGAGLRHLPLLGMPLALLLLFAGYTVKNPTAVGMEQALERPDPVRGILRITRHPVMMAILLWALVHILANGDLASLIFFGGFAVLAGTGTVLIDRKLSDRLGEPWQHYARQTSIIPFVAIFRGRQSLVVSEIGWLPLILAVGGYIVLILFHRSLFGVVPY